MAIFREVFLQDVLLRIKKASLKLVKDSATYCGHLQGGVPAGCIIQTQEGLPEGGTRFGHLLWSSSRRCSAGCITQIQEGLAKVCKIFGHLLRPSSRRCSAGCITQIQESLPESGTRFGQLLWQSSGRCSSRMYYSDSRKSP